MQTICEYLAYDHKRCDDLFLKVETSIGQHDWVQAESAFQDFCHAWLGHLDSEESIVFPALEKVTFNAAIPIAMLRMEHERMRGIVARLADALGRHDPADFLLHAETLTILAQQHELKEEVMLYPLLDRILSRNVQHIVDVLREAIESRTGSCSSVSAHPSLASQNCHPCQARLTRIFSA